jgi:hypothetical protein
LFSTTKHQRSPVTWMSNLMSPHRYSRDTDTSKVEGGSFPTLRRMNSRRKLSPNPWASDGLSTQAKKLEWASSRRGRPKTSNTLNRVFRQRPPNLASCTDWSSFSIAPCSSAKRRSNSIAASRSSARTSSSSRLIARSSLASLPFVIGLYSTTESPNTTGDVDRSGGMRFVLHSPNRPIFGDPDCRARAKLVFNSENRCGRVYRVVWVRSRRRGSCGGVLLRMRGGGRRRRTRRFLQS